MATLSDEVYSTGANRIKGIADTYRSIDPSTVQKALATQGLIEGSLGFSDPSQLMGMSPEQVGGLLDARAKNIASNQAMLKGVLDIRNMMTGNPELRQALTQLEMARTSGALQEGLQEKSFGQQEHMAGVQFANQKSLQELSQTFQAGQKDLDRDLQERMHGETIGLGKERLNLERKRQKWVEGVYSTNPAMQSLAFPANENLYGKLEQEKNNYKDEKGNIVDRKNYAFSHLKQQALGAPYGTVYNTGGFAEEIGAKQVMLANDGWHAIDAQDGKYVAKGVVLKLNPSSFMKQGKQKGEGSMVNVYGED